MSHFIHNLFLEHLNRKSRDADMLSNVRLLGYTTCCQKQNVLQETPCVCQTVLMPPAYLPLGNSPSSLRQRTVGVGSPCTSQKKSTMSSAKTTWFTGCLMNTGLSEIRQEVDASCGATSRGEKSHKEERRNKPDHL